MGRRTLTGSILLKSTSRSSWSVSRSRPSSTGRRRGRSATPPAASSTTCSSYVIAEYDVIVTSQLPAVRDRLRHGLHAGRRVRAALRRRRLLDQPRRQRPPPPAAGRRRVGRHLGHVATQLSTTRFLSGSRQPQLYICWASSLQSSVCCRLKQSTVSKLTSNYDSVELNFLQTSPDVCSTNIVIGIAQSSAGVYDSTCSTRDTLQRLSGSCRWSVTVRRMARSR